MPRVDHITVFDQKPGSPGAKIVMSMRVLVVAFGLMCSDVVTGVLAAFVFENASVVALLLFIIIHLAQMSTAPMVVLFFSLKMPDVVMWVIFGLSCAFRLMDIGEAIAVTVDHPRKCRSFRDSGASLGSTGSCRPQQAQHRVCSSLYKTRTINRR